MSRLSFLLFFCALALTACSGVSPKDKDEYVRFEFKTTGNEHFFARTSEPKVIDKAREQLSKPVKDRNLFINGVIKRGTAFNNGWSWHFVPDKWSLVEMSIEVCDGRPSYVEENINYWVDDVGRFCPFSSYVVREVARKSYFDNRLLSGYHLLRIKAGR